MEWGERQDLCGCGTHWFCISKLQRAPTGVYLEASRRCPPGDGRALPLGGLPRPCLGAHSPLGARLPLGLRAECGRPAGAPSGGAGSSQPPATAQPGCSGRLGRVSREAQTHPKSSNPRGRLTALFAVCPRTCKLSPAHMLHIKPPCPMPFLFFFPSSERVLINFPSFI